MAILTNYEGSNDDFENGGNASSSSVYRAQGFQVSAASTVSGFEIWGSRGAGNPAGTFRASILQGATPNGASVLYTEDFNSSVLPNYTGSPIWSPVTFTTPVAISGSTQYYLSIQNLTGSGNDNIRWSLDSTSPSYPNGTAWNIVPDSHGSTWNQRSTVDYNFRINGSVSPLGPTTIKTLNGISAI